MKSLLVIVDMQNDFIDGSLKNAEARAIVGNVVKKVKDAVSKGVETVFTRDTHFDGYLSTQEGKNLPVTHCVKDTFGWQIADELKTYAQTIFDKNTFGSVALAQYVKCGNYGKVELVGVCTDICVVSNALLIKSFCPEVSVVVDSSCCAGSSISKHVAALETMRSCQIQVV
ncbi:MAG: cysteine hydrolase [Corallococcus sp.]|nr:cysteine hydrolase [Corallococcus sp.]